MNDLGVVFNNGSVSAISLLTAHIEDSHQVAIFPAGIVAIGGSYGKPYNVSSQVR